MNQAGVEPAARRLVPGSRQSGDASRALLVQGPGNGRAARVVASGGAASRRGRPDLVLFAGSSCQVTRAVPLAFTSNPTRRRVGCPVYGATETVGYLTRRRVGYDQGVEEKLYREDLAALAGIKPDSLNRLKLPPRDGTDTTGGHARPWWYRSTAEEWIANRPGPGARTDLRPKG